MNTFAQIPSPKKRYRIIEYNAEDQSALDDALHFMGEAQDHINQFDDPDIDTVIASAYTFLRHQQSLWNK